MSADLQKSAKQNRPRRFAEARGSEAAFDLIEALEAEPHVGMTESAEIWSAYAKLARSLGGKPMRKWWKHGSKKPQNDQAMRPEATKCK